MVTETLKYPKPKILLLDMDYRVSTHLKVKGFNISIGSFGKPYKVVKKSEFSPVIGQSILPNYQEQEIIVIDLAVANLLDFPEGTKVIPDEEIDWWAKCSYGEIDPRPKAMVAVKDDFDRVLMHGGVFVVFADRVAKHDFICAHKYRGSLISDKRLDHNIYSFLTEMDWLNIENSQGKEIRISENSTPFSALIAKYLKGAKFNCTFKKNANWYPLAFNKVDDIVSSLYLDRKSEGLILMIPQIIDKASFLSDLLTDILPVVKPSLFPQNGKGKWVNENEYKLPQAVLLEAKKKAIEEKCKEEINEVNQEIEEIQKQYNWLYDLLTTFDKPLVEAVKEALAFIGFMKVVDVDIERDKDGKTRREDLQIQEKSPALIVDVKGIGGLPSDDEALQADKHASIRMREWRRTDVEGLTIINHQRHLPALKRDNEKPFRKEILDAADAHRLKLITTWDLYRLIRNIQKNKWQSKDVIPIFYVDSGRIEIVPLHYEYIGRIAKVWTDKFGLVIEGNLHKNDRIAVEFSIEFVEYIIESIQVNGEAKENAEKGAQTGLMWPQGYPKLKEGLRVFKVIR